MEAPLVAFDYFANTMTVLGWLIQNAVWSVMNSTGISAVPLLALIVSEWFKARQEGDEAGSKGLLTINRIETRLYAMVVIFLFTCQPIMQLKLSTVDVDAARSVECGTPQFAAGEWDSTTVSSLGGKIPNIPVWWAFVHSVSHGVTAAAITAIPCSTDFQSIRTEIDLTEIEDPALQQEVNEFTRQCFGPARNLLFQNTGSFSGSAAEDADWIGSDYFLNTPDYYDSFFAARPIPGFPYNATRDVSQPNTGPGEDGYPSCKEWWSADPAGIRERLHDQVDTGFWDSFRSVFTGADAEDYVIRRMVSPRSGAANGNQGTAVAGYRDIGAGPATVGDMIVKGSAAVGGTLAFLPFLAGMDMLEQALQMVQAIIVMAIIICLPFVMVISGYSFKVAGVATFGLFAMWFLTFWWELARWLNSNLVDLLYNSDAAKLGWLSGLDNAYDKLVLQFVEGAMFLVLPTLWVGVLAWAGMKVGSGVGNAVGDGSKGAQGAGKQGGDKIQGAATKGQPKAKDK